LGITGDFGFNDYLFVESARDATKLKLRGWVRDVSGNRHDLKMVSLIKTRDELHGVLSAAGFSFNTFKQDGIEITSVKQTGTPLPPLPGWISRTHRNRIWIYFMWRESLDRSGLTSGMRSELEDIVYLSARGAALSEEQEFIAKAVVEAFQNRDQRE